MILEISYADEKFKKAQKLNAKSALKNGADKVIRYSPDMIPDEFKRKYADIWNQPRGGGYWVWKPYIISDALSKVDEGDYVVYLDSGAAFISNMKQFIKCMEKEQTPIMSFTLEHPESKYTKRDAFILMECDSEEFVNSPQRSATYIVFKKCAITMKFLDDYSRYSVDKRIITDDDNVMGKDNYSGFVENRHDQTVYSLLAKKYKLPAFRDPSQYGLHARYHCTKDVEERSKYPQVIDSHRNPNISDCWMYYRYVPTRIKSFIETNRDRLQRVLTQK